MDVNTNHLLDLIGPKASCATPEQECATLSTHEFAALGGFRPQTARKAYSAMGVYLGVRPTKLPNGRLRWPKAQVQALYRGGSHV
jgi:hypothetical protein